MARPGSAGDPLVPKHESSSALLSGAATAQRLAVGPPVEYGNGLWIFLDITATPNNAETLQLWVEAQDPVSGKWAPVANFPTILASSLGATPPFATFLYHLYPGAVETVAQAQQDVQSLAVPPVWRARVAHSGGGSWTYTLSAIEKNI